MRMSSNGTQTDPIARIRASGANRTLTLWPYRTEEESYAALPFVKNYNGVTGLESAKWDTVCEIRDTVVEPGHHWYDEMFRDGKGGLM